jgi:hypothetical protein
MPRSHLGARDAERLGCGTPKAVWQPAPGDALLDDPLERRHVYKTAQHLAPARGAAQAERTQRHGQQIAEAEVEYVAHPHRRPGLDQLLRAQPRIGVRCGRGEGCVHSPYGGAGEDVELELRGEARVDVFEQVGENSRLVCATRPAAGQDECPTMMSHVFSHHSIDGRAGRKFPGSELRPPCIKHISNIHF